ncbi:MAG: hypothetical protein QOH70_2254 [Blastocatellia bacterium]|jgi:hypothetical protein|nr:hypothetical protein [Blastocatellia bacterium]
MDLGPHNDYYDSFIAYQKLLLKEFDRMSGEYGFEVVDASRTVKRVAGGLRKSISRIIEDEPGIEAVTAVKETAATETQDKLKAGAEPRSRNRVKAEAQEKSA